MAAPRVVLPDVPLVDNPETWTQVLVATAVAIVVMAYVLFRRKEGLERVLLGVIGFVILVLMAGVLTFLLRE